MLDALKIVHMIHLHIEDHSNGGIEVQEGIHIFTGFKNEILFSSHAESAAHGLHCGTRKHGRIHIRVHKDLGTHGGTGALAVHARNADTVTVPHHEIAHKIRTGNGRNTTLTGAKIFGIVLGDRHGINHRIIGLHITRIMRVKDLDSLLLQRLGNGGARSIRAAHPIAAKSRYARQRGHIDPADAYEKDAFAVCQHRMYGLCAKMRIFD